MAIQESPAAGSRERTTALGMSTVAFTVCFAVWTIFSIIGVQIKKDLGLTDTQFGLVDGANRSIDGSLDALRTALSGAPAASPASR